MEKTVKRVLAIINPAAGQEEPVLHTLNEVFTEADVDWRVILTQDQPELSAEARSALTEDFDVVAAYGGDGTVMKIANALRGSDMPLAILPGGTTNALAHELGVPDDLAAAARLITAPESRILPVDMGNFDDRLFFHLSAGLLGALASQTGQAAKNQSGFLAYILAGVQELQQWPEPVVFELTLDGQTETVEGVSCMVTNFGKVGIADLRLAQGIDLSDGVMDVLVIRRIDMPSLVRMVGDALASGDLSEALWHRRAREVTCAVPSGMQIMLDGEALPALDGPLTAHVVPGAVHVIAPGRG